MFLPVTMDCCNLFWRLLPILEAVTYFGVVTIKTWQVQLFIQLCNGYSGELTMIKSALCNGETYIYVCDKIFLWPSVNAVATIRFYIKIRPNNLYVDNGKGVASIEATSVKKKKEKKNG
jgi:hypothetical protein